MEKNNIYQNYQNIGDFLVNFLNNIYDPSYDAHYIINSNSNGIKEFVLIIDDIFYKYYYNKQDSKSRIWKPVSLNIKSLYKQEIFKYPFNFDFY